MNSKIRAYAAATKGQKLKAFEYDPGLLPAEWVEMRVSHCGICHSDLSMLGNEWGETTYPFVPGHEAVGTVVAAGGQVKKVRVGDTVGLGWVASSCMACAQCLSGNHNFCPERQQTIVGRHGGFADRVRCHWAWAIPLPPRVEVAKAGPLFCGGITVFTPIVEFEVRPTDRVAVVGIGGLGHLALQFLNKWGCEVWAFTSSEAKRQEALSMGAHHVVGSRDSAGLAKLAGTFNFIIVTVNVPLDWKLLLNTLAPNGRLHFVGVVLEPVPMEVASLLTGQRSVSGSPVGNPTNITAMLEFCARHSIAPRTEIFPMSRVNDALDHLRAGKARYRLVLENDFS
jgi:alcohol/geraniol dehydrogenase (NADP+)